MLDAFLLAHPFGLDGEEGAYIVEEISDHHPRDFQIVLLLLPIENVEEGSAGLMEKRQGVLVHVVVHVLFDEPVVNIKSVHGIGGSGRQRVVSEDLLAQRPGLLRLRQVGEDLLDDVRDDISVLVLGSGLLLPRRFYGGRLAGVFGTLLIFGYVPQAAVDTRVL